MKSLKFLWLMLALPTMLFAQRKQTSFKDIKKLVGSYVGTITNIDATDDKTELTIMCNLEILDGGDSLKVKQTITDAGGKQTTTEYDMLITEDATELVYQNEVYDIKQVIRQGERLIIRTIDANENAKDNDKYAEIHQTFTITDTNLTILKEVKYFGTEKLILRSRLMCAKRK
jgi:hypothetical protein